MSAFSGRQYKGAMRVHRQVKNAEAQERAAQFEAEVTRVMFEQNVSRQTARGVAAASRRIVRTRAWLATV